MLMSVSRDARVIGSVYFALDILRSIFLSRGPILGNEEASLLQKEKKILCYILVTSKLYHRIPAEISRASGCPYDPSGLTLNFRDFGMVEIFYLVEE